MYIGIRVYLKVTWQLIRVPSDGNRSVRTLVPYKQNLA